MLNWLFGWPQIDEVTKRLNERVEFCDYCGEKCKILGGDFVSGYRYDKVTGKPKNRTITWGCPSMVTTAATNAHTYETYRVSDE